MSPADVVDHEVVSKSQWLLVHGEFLAREKELTKHSDELSRQRREFPWTRVEAAAISTTTSVYCSPRRRSPVV
jgi:predicted dithiol-disulfide oxidoreductase (DUF899 family)